MFMSSDFPFVRLSKFLDIESVDYSPELKDDENIGYFKRKKGSAILEDFWKSTKFTDFLRKVTSSRSVGFSRPRKSSHLEPLYGKVADSFAGFSVMYCLKDFIRPSTILYLYL